MRPRPAQRPPAAARPAKADARGSRWRRRGSGLSGAARRAALLGPVCLCLAALWLFFVPRQPSAWPPPPPQIDIEWSPSGPQECHAYLDTAQGRVEVDGGVFYTPRADLDPWSIYFDGVDSDTKIVCVDGVPTTTTYPEDGSFPTSVTLTTPFYDGIPFDLGFYATRRQCRWIDDNSPSPGEGETGSSNDGTVGPVSVVIVAVPLPTATIHADETEVYPGTHVTVTCTLSPVSVYGSGCSVSCPGFEILGEGPDWQWNGGTEAFAVVAGTTPGDYTFTFTANGAIGGCTAQGTTETCTVTILPIPPDEEFYTPDPAGRGEARDASGSNVSGQTFTVYGSEPGPQVTFVAEDWDSKWGRNPARTPSVWFIDVEGDSMPANVGIVHPSKYVTRHSCTWIDDDNPSGTQDSIVDAWYEVRAIPEASFGFTGAAQAGLAHDADKSTTFTVTYSVSPDDIYGGSVSVKLGPNLSQEGPPVVQTDGEVRSVTYTLCGTATCHTWILAILDDPNRPEKPDIVKTCDVDIYGLDYWTPEPPPEPPNPTVDWVPVADRTTLYAVFHASAGHLSDYFETDWYVYDYDTPMVWDSNAWQYVPGAPEPDYSGTYDHPDLPTPTAARYLDVMSWADDDAPPGTGDAPASRSLTVVLTSATITCATPGYPYLGVGLTTLTLQANILPAAPDGPPIEEYYWWVERADPTNNPSKLVFVVGDQRLTTATGQAVQVGATSASCHLAHDIVHVRARTGPDDTGWRVYPSAHANLTAVRIDIANPVDSNGNTKIDDPATSANSHTGNEFTYSAASPGVLTIPARIALLPDVAELRARFESRVRVRIDAINDSHTGGPNVQLAWDHAFIGEPTAGKGEYDTADRLWKAQAAFTGLPPNNSDFATKTLTVHLLDEQDSVVLAKTVALQVFWPLLISPAGARNDANFAKNHPGPDLSSTGAENGGGSAGQRAPNWFYYWRQEIPNATEARYAGTRLGNVFGASPAVYLFASGYTGIHARIVIGEIAQDVDHTGGLTTGIDAFDDTIQHENEHAIPQSVGYTNSAFGLGISGASSVGDAHWSFNVAKPGTPPTLPLPAGRTYNHYKDSNSDSDFLDPGEDLDTDGDSVYNGAEPGTIEGLAEAAEPDSQDRRAASDWGSPGKNHGTALYSD